MNRLFEHMKSVERFGRPKSRTDHCTYEDCGAFTRMGKPFCPKHVAHHPHVESLLAELASREAEEERVRKRGAHAVDPAGGTAREVLTYLRVHGPKTLRRLARDLNRDPSLVGHYVEALRRRRRVKLSQTRRGGTVVAVVGGRSDKAA